jgi:choline kinase
VSGENNMQYKICILAAGGGSRMGHFSDAIHKAILPINNKAVISYMIEKFSSDIEIVIAVGHRKDTVIDYLTLAYPERKFTFVEVDKYSGPGSGPGYSLLACKKHLECPFIFCTSDTIVLEDVPPPNENWMGIAPVHDTEPYCTVKIKNNLIYQIDDKIKTDNKFAFIGLAGILDYKDFFAALEQNTELRNNELQMVDGFKGLLEHKLVPTGFTWFDTGTYSNYVETNKNFSGGDHKFDFSKGDEFLYFVNDRVIKFFADKSIAQKRHHRATHSLHGVSPKIEGCQGHFYSYKKVPGSTMYAALSTPMVVDFLQWMKLKVWKTSTLSTDQKETFARACHDFYHTKTKKRLAMFYEKLGMEEEPEFINGVSTASVQELLDLIDWDYLSDGMPSNFHGDLQFDNVLVYRNQPDNKNNFILLDWRHEFGNSTEVGDLYYDLAKLYGGMILSYPIIKEGKFSCDISGQHAYYYFFIKSDLIEAKECYEKFLVENGFDLRKVKILTSLIFLNMAPLHHAPFDIMLYCLGRSMLHKVLRA